MSRTLTLAAKQALAASETADAFLILLTIDHPDLAQPIRVTSDGVNTVSRGNTFIAFPFALILPDDSHDRPPRARLAIDNVDRRIVEAIRSIGSAPTVLMEIVRAADPDTVEASFVEFRLTNTRYDELVVEGDLTLESFVAEPYPATIFSPADFTALS